MDATGERRVRGWKWIVGAVSFVERSYLTRWLLLLPVVGIGTVLAFASVFLSSLMVAPWVWDENQRVVQPFGFMVATFTLLILLGSWAPSFKRTIATLGALLILGYNGLNFEKGQLNHVVDGIYYGVGLGLVLVYFRCPPRWALLVPAYWIGFFLATVPVIALTIPLDHVRRATNSPGIMTTFLGLCGSFGAVALPALISPAYRSRVAIGALIVSIVLGFVSLLEFHDASADQPQPLPTLLVGGLAAAILVIIRETPGSSGKSRHASGRVPSLG